MTGLVAAHHRLAAAALGPFIALGSHLLEFLIDFGAWSFITLCLPEVIKRVLSAPGLSVGKVALVEQSRPELVWTVDIVLVF
jgi:hypothetical protein